MTEGDAYRVNVPMSPSDLVPRPDPTALTATAVNVAKEDLRRELGAQREILESRLDAMDVATRLLSETVHRAPTEVQTQITHLRELMETRLDGHNDLSHAWRDGIEERFTEVDARFTQAQRASGEALTTALASAKELGELQNKANDAANTKTEQSVAQQLSALSALLDELRSQVTTQGSLIVPRPETDAWRQSLMDKVDAATGRNTEAIGALAARLDRGEGSESGARTQRTEGRLDMAQVIAIVAVIVAVVSAAALILKK